MRLLFILSIIFWALLPASALESQEKNPEGLTHNYLEYPFAAADFTLTDQHGVEFRLADATGSGPVVLVFLRGFG